MSLNNYQLQAKTLEATGFQYNERRDFYLSPDVYKQRWTNIAPFTTALSSAKTIKPKDLIFKMFEGRNPWIDQRFKLTANHASTEITTASSTGTSVTISPATWATAGNNFGLGAAIGAHLVGMTFHVFSNDASTSKPKLGQRKGSVLVTAVSGTDLKVKNTGASAFYAEADDWFVNSGNAHGELSYSPAAFSDELTTVYNQIQKFRTPLIIGNDVMEAALHGEKNELLRIRTEKGREHKIGLERALLFGSSPLGTGMASTDSFGDAKLLDEDGDKVRTTIGVIEALLRYGERDNKNDKQSIFSINEATYKYSNLVDDSEKIFQYIPDSGVKDAFCGNGFLSYWNKIEATVGMAGKSGWKIELSKTETDSKLGFNFRMLETPHGVIRLIPTPMLTKSPYKNSAIILDMDNIFKATWRPDMYRQDIVKDNAPDFQKDEYFSQVGLGINLIESLSFMEVV